MFVLLFEKELMNWLSLRTPNVVSSFFTLHFYISPATYFMR